MITEIKTTTFLPVDGHAGYWVCSDGHAYSSKRHNGSGWRRLAENRHDYGYAMINLRRADGKWRQVLLHRLVCKAFNGPLAGQMVRHLDGDPTNNAPSNLVCGSAKENSADRDRHGNTRRGRLHGNAKLTDSDVREIRKRRNNGEPRKEIAARFGITDVNVGFISKRKTWKHVV